MLDLVMRGMYGLDVLQKMRELDARRAGRRRVRRHPIVVAGAGRAGRRRRPSSTSRSTRRKFSAALETALAGARRVKLTAVQQDALDRADQHRLRPRGGRVVEIDRAPRPAGGAADHDVPDRRDGRSSPADAGQRSGHRAPDLLRPGRRRRAARAGPAQRRDPEGTADQRAGAAARDRPVGARSRDRDWQHPPQRLPGHVRQSAEGAGVVLGAASDAGHASKAWSVRLRSIARGFAMR